MSAAEKLKALERLEEESSFGFNNVSVYLKNALPQIAAVVEAAEQWPKPGEDGWIHVQAALAALDEALGDVT